MNAEPWEIMNSDKLIMELKKISKNQYIMNKKLIKINKTMNNKINILSRDVKKQCEINTTMYLENKIHTKNIRDMLEMFADDEKNDENNDTNNDENKGDPFMTSRMHNRMWRHSIKNFKDFNYSKDNNRRDIYRNFNSKK